MLGDDLIIPGNMEQKNSRWYEKNVLVIGDSLTADGRWQKRFAEITGANVETHAYGGIGIIEIIEGTGPSGNEIVRYDPVTCAGGDFGPLTVKW